MYKITCDFTLAEKIGRRRLFRDFKLREKSRKSYMIVYVIFILELHMIFVCGSYVILYINEAPRSRK